MAVDVHKGCPTRTHDVASPQDALGARVAGRFLLLALLLDRMATRGDLPGTTPALFRHDARIKKSEQVGAAAAGMLLRVYNKDPGEAGSALCCWVLAAPPPLPVVEQWG